MKMPRVSVCMPVYNNANYLAEAIDSVLVQLFDDFEILIIDDCSSDQTGQIARDYAAQDPRVRFLSNPANLGMVPNWNRCLEMAQGMYIKFLFGDDLLASPDTLGRMVEVLDGERDVSLVASARNVIDEESRKVETLAGFPDRVRIPGTELITRCMEGLIHNHNPIGEPSVVMFRRDAAGRGFDPRYRQLVDLEMWFHLLEQGIFAYLAEPLCAFRSHGEQQTVKNRQDFSYIDDMFYLHKDYMSRSYIRIGSFARQYAFFQLAYLFWKKLRGEKAALQKIGTHIPFSKFIPQLILYRLYVPFRSISRYITKRWRTLKGKR